MKTPAPQSSLGHSRLNLVILPFSSTCKIIPELTVLPNRSSSIKYSICDYLLCAEAGCIILSSLNYNLEASSTHLVVFEYSKLDLLPLVLDLLGGGVILLLPLLTTSSQSQH